MRTVGPGAIAIAVPDRHVDTVLQYGAREALLHGADLELIHVLRPAEDHAAAEQLVDEAVRLVELLAGPGVLVGGQVVVGEPVAAALHATADAREVVVRERDALYLMRAVVEHSSDRLLPPVVFVPDGWAPTPDDRRPVLVGIEDVTRCDNLVRAALELAQVHRTGLAVVHAWHLPGRYDERVDPRVAEQWSRMAERELVSATASAAGQRPPVPIDIRVEHGRPAELLLQAARGAQLLVLEQNAPSAGVGGRLGRTSRAAIHESPCPVQLLPPGSACEDVLVEPGGGALTDIQRPIDAGSRS